MKFCPFFIDGPIHQRLKMQPYLYGTRREFTLNTMQNWGQRVDPTTPDYIMMPCVHFQAELRFSRLAEGRIMMLDVYGRQWQVYLSSADAVLPAMQKGVLNAWWTMAKKGNAYGLTVDLQTPLMPTVPMDQDVPQMLETVADLNMVMREFEAMAV